MAVEFLTPEGVGAGLLTPIVHIGRREAQKEIETKYGQSLPYHGVLHSIWRVPRRVELILETVREADPHLLTLKHIALGKISAEFHDIRQRWEEENGKRKRLTGKNEEESAEVTAQFLQRMNAKYRQHGTIFTPEDIDLVKTSIIATTPALKDDKLIQPLLTPDSHPVTVALCMSDVKGPLIDGPETFIPDGDALFREDNMDIMRALTERGVKGLSKREKEDFRKRMIDWLKSQIVFVKGQQELVDLDLRAIPEPGRSKVRKLFQRGDESIEALMKVIEERDRIEDFESLVDKFGYIPGPRFTLERIQSITA